MRIKDSKGNPDAAPLSSAGIFPLSELVAMGLAVRVLKIAWELAALPLSLPLIGWLKRQEQTDHFDRDTDFNPFSLSK